MAEYIRYWMMFINRGTQGKTGNKRAKDWIARGNKLYDLGRYKEALRCYYKALEIDPKNLQTYVNIAKAYYSLGRFGEAKKIMDRALRIEERADAWNLYGMINYKLKDFEEAKKAFERATEKDPEVKKYWSNLGWILEKLEKYREALDAFDRALEIDPGDTRIWYERGLCLEKIGEWEEAMNSFNKALEINPDFDRAREQKEKIQAKFKITPKKLAREGEFDKAAGVSAVKIGRDKIRDMYGVEEKELSYTWGEFTAYSIVKKIGSGGFSDVYLVDREERKYAMKIPKGTSVDGDETIVISKGEVENYGKEAELWAMLTERTPRSVINLVDAGIRPFPWFVMELGEYSLRDKMGEMSEKEKIELMIDLLGKLDKIHHFGVVHKDIKPENILYAGGEWKFTDFGLSKILSKSSKSTSIMSGTWLYMAPEQVSKKKFGHTDWRTDIWQMGVMLYEVLTGRVPFEGDDVAELGMSIVMGEPVPATEYGVSEELWIVIEKALEKRKEKRWQSAGEMKMALKRVLEG